jgi:hypothetical protein
MFAKSACDPSEQLAETICGAVFAPQLGTLLFERRIIEATISS